METNKPKVDFSINPKLLIDQPVIKESFINTLMKIHKKSEADAEMIYEREAMYYKKALSEPNNRLKDCTGISLYSAFLEIAIEGLSIQPGNKSEAYFESRNSKGGKDEKGNDIWVSTARLVITAYGELNLRIMAGQIIRMNNPIVLYEGDTFQPCTNDQGRLIVKYMTKIPRQQGAKIFGCYVSIELPHNGLDFKWLLDDDIERLKKYSIPRGGRDPKANALYSSNGGEIDPGFLEAKCIKHAMRAYTKLKVGDSVSFEGDEEEIKETSFEGQKEEAPKEEIVTIKELNGEKIW
jgi:recombinational DNA repair protein RecT